jgi:putative ABC transport system ATP-binding protein
MSVMEKVSAVAPHAVASTPIIMCHSVSKDYVTGSVRVRALDNVTLDIGRGEFVAIMGASGSGKSTFMNMVGALDTPTSGQVLINGSDIATMTSDELAKLRNETIGFVFQQFNLLARTTALDNVRLPLLYADDKPEDVEERCTDALKTVGLGDRMDHMPSQLSGGQQQRVAIARALVNHPKIILADEPTGALDTQTSAEIMELFTKLNETGITIVLVTHEPDIADYARRQIHFRDGHVVEDRRR